MIQETADSLSAALNGRLGFINQGAGRPEIRVYGGSRPASPALAPDTALLAAVELQDPAGSVSAGVLTLLLPGVPADQRAALQATLARISAVPTEEQLTDLGLQ